ncbi:ankyrin repeat domain-containing protein 60 isoform X2 [Paroedura picta]|uniref:ankyrin repeat domain-containing protein 60 isoform X2 n=1 Tax=Paroedura picta TaxID=143630 RepID=UPI00405666C7
MSKSKKKKDTSHSSSKLGVSSLLHWQHSVRSGDFVGPARFFSVKLHVVETEEIFSVPECHRDLMMGSLKSRLEILVGIPVNFLRLQYLDEADLSDHSTFKDNDIIQGSTITIRIWSQDAWGRLVRAAVKGNPAKLQGLGATKTSLFRTAHSDLLNPEERAAWLAHRSFVALFVSARRGLQSIVEFLLQNGRVLHSEAGPCTCALIQDTELRWAEQPSMPLLRGGTLPV